MRDDLQVELEECWFQLTLLLTFLRSPLWWCVKFILEYKKLSQSLEPHFNFDFILWNQDTLKCNHSFESMHCHSITCHSKKKVTYCRKAFDIIIKKLKKFSEIKKLFHMILSVDSTAQKFMMNIKPLAIRRLSPTRRILSYCFVESCRMSFLLNWQPSIIIRDMQVRAINWVILMKIEYLTEKVDSSMCDWNLGLDSIIVFNLNEENEWNKNLMK